MDVLVIDDHEIERAGRELVLARRGHRVAAVGWADARSVTSEAPVVLAVIRRDPTSFDRWERIRSAGPLHRFGAPDARHLVLLADALPLGPMAQLRLRRSGADAIIDGRTVTTGDHLHALVQTECIDTPPPLRLDDGRIRIGPRCDPEAVVAHVLAKGAVDGAFLQAFEPGTTQHQSGVTRRRAHTLRRKVAELGDLSAVPPASGGPVRDLSLPRWSDIVDFVNRCRGWDEADLALPASPMIPVLARPA